MFYFLDENIMYYSVKNNTKIFIKCEKHRHTSEYADEILEISGQGQVRLWPSCTVTTPDGSIFRTRQPEVIQNLTNIPVFEILRHFPQPTGYEISNEELNETIFTLEQKIPLPERDDESIPTLAEIIAEAFKPKKSLTFIFSAVLLALTVLMFLIMIYLCRYKGMACLRIMHLTSAPKHKHEESPVDIEERKMRQRFIQMQQDIYDIQEKVLHGNNEKKHQRRHSVHSMHDIDASERQDPVYVAMYQPNRSYEGDEEIDKFIDKYQHSDRFPTILRKQLAEADKAYQKE